jgi:hypothetical protein
MSTDNVRPFPTPPLSAGDLADIQAMFNRPALTLDELLHGDLAAINAVGPWVMNPDSPATETARRIAAIAGALTGGSAVQLDDGIAALRRLVAKLQRQVTA